MRPSCIKTSKFSSRQSIFFLCLYVLGLETLSVQLDVLLLGFLLVGGQKEMSSIGVLFRAAIAAELCGAICNSIHTRKKLVSIFFLLRI